MNISKARSKEVKYFLEVLVMKEREYNVYYRERGNKEKIVSHAEKIRH